MHEKSKHLGIHAKRGGLRDLQDVEYQGTYFYIAGSLQKAEQNLGANSRPRSARNGKRT